MRFLGALLLTAQAFGAISLVNTAVGSRENGTSCVTTPLSTAAASHTTGNLLAVGLRLSSGSAFDNDPSVADTAGNTYMKASRADFAGAGGSDASVWLYYAKNITGNASNVVTVTYAGAAGTPQYCTITVLQYSGLDTSSPLDVTSQGNTSSGASVTSDPFTTTSTAEVIVGMVGVGALSQTYTAGTGYTKESTSSGGSSAMEDKIVATTQTGVTASMTWASTSAENGIAVAVFSVASIPHPFDIYGGRVSLPCNGGAKTRFYTEKRVKHWWLCTPAGNSYFLQGVANAQVDTTNLNGAGTSNQDYVIAKYGDANTNWAKYESLRMSSWGFNSLVENISAYLFPWNVASGGAKVPIISTGRSSAYAEVNDSNYGGTNGATKDIIWCGQNQSIYNGVYTGGFPDVFDPVYNTYVTARYADTLNQTSFPTYAKLFTDPYSVGFFPDDSDNLVGIGPDITAIGGPSVFHPNDGWLALASKPTISSCTNPANSGVFETYADTKNYTKSQIIADLTTKYVTIGALNTAWGSTYTTFGSAGGWPKASTSGTGLQDEDGSSSWMGDHDGSGTSTNANALADMNTFLLKQWQKYYTVQVTAFHAYSAGLFFSPVLNEDHGISRPQVLQAAAASDVVTAAVFTQELLDDTVLSTGDVPILYDQIIQPGNPDSALWQYEIEFGYPANYRNQPDKATSLGSFLNFFLTGKVTSTGIAPVIGYTYWALVDSASEKQDFGLTSIRDNAYDGVESCVATSTNQFGQPIGGEDSIPSWQATHAYTTAAGNPSVARSLIQASTGGTNYYWQSTVSGTSGGSTPNWASATTLGATVTDGSVTWQNYGVKTLPACFGNFIGPITSLNALWFANTGAAASGVCSGSACRVFR